MYCSEYCGVHCVDGSCPIALRDEYAEYGCDVISECSQCGFNGNCADCINCEICPRNTVNQ